MMAMPFDWWRPSSRMPRRSGTSRTRARKRRILQSLVSRIVLTDDDVKIEWAF